MEPDAASLPPLPEDCEHWELMPVEAYPAHAQAAEVLAGTVEPVVAGFACVDCLKLFRA